MIVSNFLFIAKPCWAFLPLNMTFLILFYKFIWVLICCVSNHQLLVHSETLEFNAYQIEIEPNRIENVEKDRPNEFRFFDIFFSFMIRFGRTDFNCKKFLHFLLGLPSYSVFTSFLCILLINLNSADDLNLTMRVDINWRNKIKITK